MNSDPKVLCALSHGLYEPWISILENGQKVTWLSEEFPENFHLIHFHGTPVSKFWFKVDKAHEFLRWFNIWSSRLLKLLDTVLTYPLLKYIPKYTESRFLYQNAKSIHVVFPDTYLTYRWKLLSLLNYFVSETDDDFLFITSTASYIQPDLLLSFIGNLPMDKIYAGAEPYPGAGFISGSNRIFSRDVAEQVIANRFKWKPGVIEDVAVSTLIKSLGNKLVMFPISNISSTAELKATSDTKLKTTYHFRLKSGSLEARNDGAIMRELHLRVKNLKGEKIE